MLCAVRNSASSLIFLVATILAFLFLPGSLSHSSTQQEVTPPQQAPTSQQPTPAPLPVPAPPAGPVIVIDPAHGGTDTGARGENSVTEKDIVLQIARTVREQLSRQGFRVLLTRNDDSNPSYDDRAAIANAHGEAMFISLHISSTGAPASIRTYYDQFSTPEPMANVQIAKPFPAQSAGLPSWHDAQRPYVDTSHRLADLIQVQLIKSFPGSPGASIMAPVRELRSVNEPAVAIELSSISGSTPEALAGSALSIANAISAGVSAFRQNSAGAK